MSNPVLDETSTSVPVGGVAFRSALSLRTPVGRFVWFAIALIVCFGRPLFALARYAAHDTLNSYIVLVPFVSAYLLYVRRCELPRTDGRPSAWSVVPLLTGVGSLGLALAYRSSLVLNDYFTLTTFSFVCLLIAGVLFFLGKRWILAAAFPIIFLYFLVPMPVAMADTLETGLKVASAEVASLFFDMAGTPVLREGTFFQLPNIAIQVAQECSGVRSSLVLVITSLVAANLFLHTNWRRALLVCFVVPLGIIRNGFRVFVIGSLCVHYGPQMIHSVIHRRGGPLFFTLSLIPLFAFLWWLSRGERVQNSDIKSEQIGIVDNSKNSKQ